MGQFGIEAAVFDGAHVEPTDASLEAAIAHARDTGPWDAFVAVGGGSAIDTAKAVNLLTTNDGELMDYVNAPVGKGRNPEKPLKPLVAVPTTTGTGAESHHDLRARRARPEGEDRHQPPAAAADAGRRRPGADADPAGRGHLGGRDGHPVPRAGELHRAAVHAPTTRSSRSSGCPTAAPTRSPTCGRRRRCRCWPASFRQAVHHGDDAEARHADGAGRDVRRARLRQRRRAHPARQRLPDRRPGQGLPPRGLPRRRADGAARHGGLADRARGVPLDLRGLARAPPARGVAARARPRRTTAPTPCRACSPT